MADETPPSAAADDAPLPARGDGGTSAPLMAPEPPAATIEDEPPALEPGYRLSFILDPDGLVRRVAEARGIRDWPQEGFVGRTLGDISAERAGAERGDLWDVRIERAKAAEAPELYLDRIPGAPVGDPASVSSTVTPVRTAEGELQAIVVEIEDLTKVGPREAQLETSERRFRELAESLPQMVWESDGAGNARYFSPKWEAFSGRSATELMGRGYTELLHPDDRARVFAESQHAGNAARATRFRLLRHDGEYRWMEAHIEILRDEQGRPVKAIGTTIDVTDRRAEEEAQLRSQKREMVGTLLGGIGHDFNNVLSAIISNAALARQELAAGQSPHTSLAEIERGAARAADLVRRVLVHGRDDDRQSGPVDVGAVTREACDLVRATVPGSVDLVVDCEPGLPSITADATQIHQLVLNLVTNASQALAPMGGTIRVRVAGAPGPGGRARHSIVLQVRDDGPGMPDDVRERVFDPYFTTKPAGEGSGLGLAAVQTIVRALQGTVGVDSAPGEGATFTVRLPVSQAGAPDGSGDRTQPASADGPSATPAAAAPAPADGGRTRPLMFVDDEPALVQLAERALPADGLHPVGFTDPLDALSAFAAAPDAWCALITDLSMPGLDGLTLIERILEARPGLPVVLTSGYLQAADRERARDLGVTAIVPKPCSMSALASAVQAASR